MEIIPEEKQRTESLNLGGGLCPRQLPTPPLCPQSPGIAFGIRDPKLLSLCEPATLSCSIEPAFSYKRHFVRSDLWRCIFSTAQCKPVLTGTSHAECRKRGTVFPFFKESICTHGKHSSCFVPRGPPLKRGVRGCVWSGRLRFSTHSVVGQSLHSSHSRFCLVFASAERTILQNNECKETRHCLP